MKKDLKEFIISCCKDYITSEETCKSYQMPDTQFVLTLNFVNKVNITYSKKLYRIIDTKAVCKEHRETQADESYQTARVKYCKGGNEAQVTVYCATQKLSKTELVTNKWPWILKYL
jgi:2-C-methyl-D-erythritol 4-phosphate cytidylyltransferase